MSAVYWGGSLPRQDSKTERRIPARAIEACHSLLQMLVQIQLLASHFPFILKTKEVSGGETYSKNSEYVQTHIHPTPHAEVSDRFTALSRYFQ